MIGWIGVDEKRWPDQSEREDYQLKRSGSRDRFSNPRSHGPVQPCNSVHLVFIASAKVTLLHLGSWRLLQAQVKDSITQIRLATIRSWKWFRGEERLKTNYKQQISLEWSHCYKIFRMLKSNRKLMSQKLINKFTWISKELLTQFCELLYILWKF